jgi:drug/metabolite transporter (DMT)-like permease
MGFTWLALLFIALSSLAYSGLDLFRKLLVEGMRPMPLLFFLSIGQVPPFLAWLAFEPTGVGCGYALPATGSVVLNIVANLLFLEAVRLSPLSLTVPFLALTPVFTAAIAVPMLGEVPTGLQVGGILLVVAGALRINLARGASGTPAALWRAFRSERGSVLMALVALLWSVASPLDKLAMEHASVPFHGLVLNAGVGVGVLLVMLGRRQGAEVRLSRAQAMPMLLAILASVLGLAFLLLAIAATWVGLVETLKRALGSALALVIGYRVFKEPVTGNMVLGIVLMALGVALTVY